MLFVEAIKTCAGSAQSLCPRPTPATALPHRACVRNLWTRHPMRHSADDMTLQLMLRIRCQGWQHEREHAQDRGHIFG